MTQYVVGFLFDHSRKAVALVEKKRPAWQAGKMNGIGGKVEQGETPKEAMSREFREEAGGAAGGYNWENMLTLEGKDFQVHVFRAFTDHFKDVDASTDERIFIVPLTGITSYPQVFESVPNLRWIIPFILEDSLERPHVIRYKFTDQAKGKEMHGRLENT